MSKPISQPFVPANPAELTVAAYRPAGGSQASLVCLATVVVGDTRAIQQMADLLNGLTERGLPPPSGHPRGTGAHDLLRFRYENGATRAVRVARDGDKSVTVEGLRGVFATTMPLYATIDTLLPERIRSEIGNPASYPPSQQPHYLSEEDAITIVLDRGCGPLPAEHPPIYARLMTRAATAELDSGLGANNYAPHPARKVWVVSVHVDVRTRGSIASPSATVHGYSVVIDAETGMVTDMGWGSAPLGAASCPQCREKQSVIHR
jgi:hypothetical protein